MSNPFAKWTPEDARRHNEKFERKALEKWTPAAKSESKAVEREADLHDAIIAHCKSKGWLYFHSRMDRKTGRTAGEPDFQILMDGGRVLFIEAKAKAGKLSTEQIAVHAWAKRLGHEIHTVYNMEQFTEATK